MKICTFKKKTRENNYKMFRISLFFCPEINQTLEKFKEIIKENFYFRNFRNFLNRLGKEMFRNSTLFK